MDGRGCVSSKIASTQLLWFNPKGQSQYLVEFVTRQAGGSRVPQKARIMGTGMQPKSRVVCGYVVWHGHAGIITGCLREACGLLSRARTITYLFPSRYIWLTVNLALMPSQLSNIKKSCNIIKLLP
jgi:hypothetical protein